MKISLSVSFLPSLRARGVALVSPRMRGVHQTAAVLPLLALGLAAGSSAAPAGSPEGPGGLATGASKTVVWRTPDARAGRASTGGGDSSEAESRRAVRSGPDPVGRLAIGMKADDGLAAVAVNGDGIVRAATLGVRNGEIVVVPARRLGALADIAIRPEALSLQATDNPALSAAASQTGALADTVIAGILGGAAHDAADAAFGTDNVDFAIRKGFVTTIGRVPPAIGSITGDLGSTRCDTQVKADGTIISARICSR